MTKGNFILSSIFSELLFWSVKHTSIYENSEVNVLKNMKTVGEISSNWRNDLFWTSKYETIESDW